MPDDLWTDIFVMGIALLAAWRIGAVRLGLTKRGDPFPISVLKSMGIMLLFLSLLAAAVFLLAWLVYYLLSFAPGLSEDARVNDASWISTITVVLVMFLPNWLRKPD